MNLIKWLIPVAIGSYLIYKSIDKDSFLYSKEGKYLGMVEVDEKGYGADDFARGVVVIVGTGVAAGFVSKLVA